VKIDDDVYLNVPKILQFLHAFPTSSTAQDLIAGHKYSDVEPNTDPSSKWYTPSSVWSSDRFPDFVSGICYILGSRARSRLYQCSLTSKLMFHLEDVFITGIVRDQETRGLEVVNIPEVRFWWTIWQRLFYSCSYVWQKSSVIHPLSPSELVCYYESNMVCRNSSLLPMTMWC